jgi:hypothetical protein
MNRQHEEIEHIFITTVLCSQLFYLADFYDYFIPPLASNIWYGSSVAYRGEGG